MRDLLRTAFAFLLTAAYFAPTARGQAAYRVLHVSPEPVERGWYGDLLAGLDDVDGDGRGDFAIGQPGNGRVYVYSGGTLDLLHTIPVYPLTELHGTPDYDGDGLSDLLVSAPVQLYSGGTGALLRTFTPSMPYGDITSVAAVPDTDGDGVLDLVIGAGPAFGDGRVELLSGTTGALLHAFTDPNTPFPSEFGSSVSGVPDADGDGRGDVLIGAPSCPPPTGGRGI
jgi:hypothetical protein